MPPANNQPSTALPERPRLRRVDSFPVRQPDGQMLFAMRDPEGFSGAVVLPYPAAVLASLMDGNRTLAEMREDLERQLGYPVGLDDVESVVRNLDERYFLDTERFRALWKTEIESYLNRRERPAAHAGSGYTEKPEELGRQIATQFTDPRGPGAPHVAKQSRAGNGKSGAATGRLCGVLSPHVDFARGGPVLAWAHRRIAEETDADLFIILGTAHSPMRNLYGLTRKHFVTPLGTVETDQQFVKKLAARFSAAPECKDTNLFADELAHRQEHSIEFQLVFLQYLLEEKRPFKIVPILVGSFHEFIAAGTSPSTSPQVSAFVSAVRETAAEHAGRVCYISSGDLAHIGQRYGDRSLVDPQRLKQQAEIDRELVAAACRPDADAFFQRIVREQDRHRVCGLSPTYTMLQAMQPKRGELLRYDQAVELDGTSCVSFAAAAFYDK